MSGRIRARADLLRRVVEQALRQSSSDFVTLALTGRAYFWIGDNMAPLDCLKKAGKLGGRSPWSLSIRGGLALASVQLGEDEEAIRRARECLNSSVGYAMPHRILAAGCALLGRNDEAKDALAAVLQLDPDDSINAIQARNVFAVSERENRYIAGLRLAGLRLACPRLACPRLA